MRSPSAARALVAAAVAAALLAPAPAGAVVLREDELADSSTELGAVLRSFHFVLGGEVLRPPLSPEDASPSGDTILDVRPYFVERRPPWKLVLHGQLTSDVRSHAAGGGLPLGRGFPPPRMLPLEASTSSGPTLELSAEVDWMYVAWSAGRTTVTAGRQPVSIGRGVIFRPEDRIATFSLTEVDTEYKPGVDAVRLDVSAPARLSFMALAVGGELEPEDDDLQATLGGSAFVLRAKRGFDRGEAAVLGGYVRGDWLLAADGMLDVGPFDLYGEATLTAVGPDSIDPPPGGERDLVPQALLGASFRPLSSVTARVEALYNGFGAWEAEDYLDELLSPRVGLGEQTTLGRLQGGLIADWEVDALLHLQAGAIANLADPSALVLLGLTYDVAEDVDLVAGAYLPVGEGPAPTLVSLPRLESEYGFYPWFGYIELKTTL